MERILWILTILGVVIGSVFFVQGLIDDSAPRQAAAAGLALCCASYRMYLPALSVNSTHPSWMQSETNIFGICSTNFL